MAEEQAEKRKKFGNRFLTSDDDVFKHNAWDNVQWDEEQLRLAAERVAVNSASLVDEQARVDYDQKASEYWDRFYSAHQREFFKDRHWLFTEFEELTANSDRVALEPSVVGEDSYPGAPCRFKIFEIGCGVGNTIVPVLQLNL